jgi:hypothetical protein
LGIIWGRVGADFGPILGQIMGQILQEAPGTAGSREGLKQPVKDLLQGRNLALSKLCQNYFQNL